ncbi:MAG: transcription initiation factor IIB family protein [Nitrososphaerota archaeon]|nr:transcription initiation factor IIB family protein [Nitrososphaerota archaeon]
MFPEDTPRWKSLLQLERAFDRCPGCGRPSSMLTDGESGEVMCGACGIVVRGGAVDFGPDWHAGSKREDRRGGEQASEVMGDLGHSTKIGREVFPTDGAVRNLRTWDAWSPVSKKARSLKTAVPRIRRSAEKLSLPGTAVERAAQVYQKAFTAGLVRRRSVEVAAAALYFASREVGIPRTLRQVAKASDIGRKDVARSYRALLKGLDLKVQAPVALKYISGIASRADISEKSRRRAVELFDQVEKKGAHWGRNPASVAAAVLYLACLLEGEHATGYGLAAAAGVTECTVRNVKKLFADVLRFPRPV